MKLDAQSPTLVTDWGSAVLGRPMPYAIIADVSNWLAKRDRREEKDALSFLEIDAQDGMVLTRFVQPGARQYFFSYKGGPLYDIGKLSQNYSPTQVQERLKKRIANSIFVIERGYENARELMSVGNPPVRNFPWTSDGLTISRSPKSGYRRLARELASTALIRLKNAHLDHRTSASAKALLSVHDESLLQAALPDLAIQFRKRLRAPQIRIIRMFLAKADRSALGVMRKHHDFDNRLYGYLTGSFSQETRKRRRQFALAFPALLRFTYDKTKSSGPLLAAVDAGQPILSGSGLDAVANVLQAESGVEKISPDTAKAYAQLQPRRLRQHVWKAITDQLPVLDRIPPANWPHTTNGFEATELILSPLERLLQRRLVRDTGSDWDGLHQKARASVQHRFLVAAHGDVHEAERRALSSGEMPLYALPIPLPWVKTEDLKNVKGRVVDFGKMIIQYAIAPAIYAARGQLLLGAKSESPDLLKGLLASATYRQLIEASEQWHEPRRLERHRVDMAKLDPRMASAADNSWLPYFDSLTVPKGTSFKAHDIGRIRFIELTTPPALIDEGQKMKHCVAGYASYCGAPIGKFYGGSHIVSIRDENDERLSTLHFMENMPPATKTRDFKKINLVANLTLRDQKPESRAIVAGEWLADQINRGNIPELHTLEARENRRKILNEGEEDRIRRIAENPERVRLAFEATRRLFPSAWRHCLNGVELFDLAMGALDEPEHPKLKSVATPRLQLGRANQTPGAGIAI